MIGRDYRQWRVPRPRARNNAWPLPHHEPAVPHLEVKTDLQQVRELAGIKDATRRFSAKCPDVVDLSDVFRFLQKIGSKN